MNVPPVCVNPPVTIVPGLAKVRLPLLSVTVPALNVPPDTVAAVLLNEAAPVTLT